MPVPTLAFSSLKHFQSPLSLTITSKMTPSKMFLIFIFGVYTQKSTNTLLMLGNRFYGGGFASGLTIPGGSGGGGCDRKIADASDTGIMQSALDCRNCIAAPMSCSISLATCCSVPSFDHFSHAACAPSTPSPFV